MQRGSHRVGDAGRPHAGAAAAEQGQCADTGHDNQRADERVFNRRCAGLVTDKFGHHAPSTKWPAAATAGHFSLITDEPSSDDYEPALSSSPDTVVKVLFRLVPTACIATIAAIEMRAAIRPYSIAVAPDSLASNDLIVFVMKNTPSMSR